MHNYALTLAEERTFEQQKRADQDNLFEPIKDTVITVEGIHFPAIDFVKLREDYHYFSL